MTRPPWPAGVPRGPYGPRVQAAVALWTGASRFSKRTTVQVMDHCCGVPMRVGTGSQGEHAPAEGRAAPVAEARAYVHEPAVASREEARGRQGATCAWRWGAVTSLVTVVRGACRGEATGRVRSWGPPAAGVS